MAVTFAISRRSFLRITGPFAGFFVVGENAVGLFGEENVHLVGFGEGRPGFLPGDLREVVLFRIGIGRNPHHQMIIVIVFVERDVNLRRLAIEDKLIATTNDFHGTKLLLAPQKAIM